MGTREAAAQETLTRTRAVVFVFSFCLCVVRKSREMVLTRCGYANNLSRPEVGKIMSMSFAYDIFVSPATGYLFDAAGRLPTASAAMLGMSVAFLTLAKTSVTTYVCFAVLSGLANGLSSGFNQLMAADLAPGAD